MSDLELRKPPGGVLRPWWDKVATVLALISLVDLTSQLIKWAALIHSIATQYAAARTWLFGLLPFHIPPEWHDYIVLLAIFFSVANVGFYRQTGEIYLLRLGVIPLLWAIGATAVQKEELKRTNKIDRVALAVTEVGFLLLSNVVTYSLLGWGVYLMLGYDNRLVGWMANPLVLVTVKYLGLCALVGASGLLIAWRWIIGTSALFGVLVAVNEIYMRWIVSTLS